MLLAKSKQRLRNWVRRVPVIGPMTLSAYRSAELLKRQLLAHIRSQAARELPDPETVYWIDPARVVLHTNYDGHGRIQAPKDRVFDMQRDKGRVIGGSWDCSTYAFDDLDVVQAIRARIASGVAWTETEFYRRLLREVRSGEISSWGINSESDLNARCDYIDRLINSIRQRGYLECHQVCLENESKGINGHSVYGSEITVNIGRNGHYLFQDGRHRLAVAKFLGVKSVPVKVLVRHPDWVEFRQYLWALATGGATTRKAELYQNPVHPDLQDIPFAHDCEDRFSAIAKSAGHGSGPLLDIGANLGFFCHGFEKLGYSCIAVERQPEYAKAADVIRIAEQKTFKIIGKDLFEAWSSERLNDRHYSVVLALNIFHHFLKHQDTFEQFSRWLHELSADTMYFEPHCSEEPQMAGAYRNFTEHEFVAFISENTKLSHAELVHRCSDGRPIYRLWRRALESNE